MQPRFNVSDRSCFEALFSSFVPHIRFKSRFSTLKCYRAPSTFEDEALSMAAFPSFCIRFDRKATTQPSRSYCYCRPWLDHNLNRLLLNHDVGLEIHPIDLFSWCNRQVKVPNQACQHNPQFSQCHGFTQATTRSQSERLLIIPAVVLELDWSKLVLEEAVG